MLQDQRTGFPGESDWPQLAQTDTILASFTGNANRENVHCLIFTRANPRIHEGHTQKNRYRS